MSGMWTVTAPGRARPADRVDPVELAGVAVLAEQMDLVAEPGERLGQARVVDVGAGAPEQVAVEDEDAHPRVNLGQPRFRRRRSRLVFRPMSNAEQTYRLRAPASGREASRRDPPATASTSTARPARRWSR